MDSSSLSRSGGVVIAELNFRSRANRVTRLVFRIWNGPPPNGRLPYFRGEPGVPAGRIATVSVSLGSELADGRVRRAPASNLRPLIQSCLPCRQFGALLRLLLLLRASYARFQESSTGVLATEQCKPHYTEAISSSIPNSPSLSSAEEAPSRPGSLSPISE